MRTYVVRQGDFLTRIAASTGVTPETIWNHPANRALRDERGDPEILLPGDKLQLPDRPDALPLRPKAANRFTAKRPVVAIDLEVRVGDARLANEPFVVEGGPIAGVTGTTDAAGRVHLEVPLATRSLRLVFEKKGLVLDVRMGALDPVDEPSGARQRLEHLGFRGAYHPDEHPDVDRLALCAFQERNGLVATGELDARTCEKLRDAHGS